MDAESSTSPGVKLNEASLYIEAPLVMEASQVRLRLEPNLKVRGAPRGRVNTGMFPGTIVAMKGKTSNDECFSVKEIIYQSVVMRLRACPDADSRTDNPATTLHCTC